MALQMRVTGKPALAIVGKVFLCMALAGLLIAGTLAVFEIRGRRTAQADGVIVRYDAFPVVAFTTPTESSG